MFKRIADQISFPQWADARYKRLDIYDRLLDGTFYDHLSSSFYDESENGTHAYIPLHERRPSARYNICAWVSRKIARSLFAGRHAPRFAHSNKALQEAATAIATEGFLNTKLLLAAVWGAVGAVAVTFRLDDSGEGQPRIVFAVWRAKYCMPRFDVLGELSSLQIRYLTYGQEFISMFNIAMDDRGRPIAPGELYWFVKEIDTERETIYQPKPKDDWPPTEQAPLLPLPEDKQPEPHDFGFVPGHWFVNLAGGEPPDGECTFKLGIDTSIDLDYNLSALGRGVRYNASPEVVLIGARKNATINPSNNKTIIRGPTHVIEMEAPRRDPAGNMTGGGDAKLLEMTGQGIAVGLELVEKYRQFALEAISASRKNPDKLSTPMSGRAMEGLDDDPLNLMEELRTGYGDNGALPLMRKAMRAAALFGHRLLDGVDLTELDSLAYYWPKPYQPGAQELGQIGQGLVSLTTPIPKAGPPTLPVNDGPKPATETEVGAAAPTPQPAAPGTEKILEVDEARRLLFTLVDIPPDTATVPEQQEPVPEGGGSPPDPHPTDLDDAQADDEAGGGDAKETVRRLSKTAPRAPKRRAPKRKVTP